MDTEWTKWAHWENGYAMDMFIHSRCTDAEKKEMSPVCLWIMSESVVSVHSPCRDKQVSKNYSGVALCCPYTELLHSTHSECVTFSEIISKGFRSLLHVLLLLLLLLLLEMVVIQQASKTLQNLSHVSTIL